MQTAPFPGFPSVIADDVAITWRSVRIRCRTHETKWFRWPLS